MRKLILFGLGIITLVAIYFIGGTYYIEFVGTQLYKEPFISQETEPRSPPEQAFFEKMNQLDFFEKLPFIGDKASDYAAAIAVKSVGSFALHCMHLRELAQKEVNKKRDEELDELEGKAYRERLREYDKIFDDEWHLFLIEEQVERFCEGWKTYLVWLKEHSIEIQKICPQYRVCEIK